MNRIVVSEEHDPYYNLALEEDLLKNVRQDEVILYLWQNEKTVVIGRNQNPYLECDVSELTARGIHLARRISGGGAVYHDLGNLNFTFIYNESNKNLEKQLNVIKKAVETFGVAVELSGRNDLTIQGQKFSGHAFYAESGNEFHHGTLMVDVELSQLAKVLKPSKLKMEAKGITSVKSRVVNLKKLNPSFSVDKLIELLTIYFTEAYGETCKPLIYNSKNYTPTNLNKYNDPKWIYGESPKYDVILERKTSLGIIQVLLNVENGLIKTIKIHTDSLITISFDQIEVQWIGMDFNHLHEDKLFNEIEDLLKIFRDL
ncbi:lipoate--protein ligase [Paenibacillus sp. KQZ6P-2]|uniref:lipoate--protein ligase n=1 Tax=Paenibacillus mangrovi TaxID=2931978 RepID=A0A9X2B7F3_9BACL|nr:lipoate--protein ligase [Paenibacillus mangrovi]MCJ8013608.1 lipoate--protein ligase [Paenibacillus mangrovi]